MNDECLSDTYKLPLLLCLIQMHRSPLHCLSSALPGANANRVRVPSAVPSTRTPQPQDTSLTCCRCWWSSSSGDTSTSSPSNSSSPELGVTDLLTSDELLALKPKHAPDHLPLNFRL